jgi:hypothetical protein
LFVGDGRRRQDEGQGDMATDTKREAVISSELANTIADYVESLGHTSLFTSVTDGPGYDHRAARVRSQHALAG